MWKLWFRLNAGFAAAMLGAMLLVSRFHDRIDARPIIVLGLIGGVAFGVRSYRILHRELERRHNEQVTLINTLQPIVDDMAQLPWEDLALFPLALAKGPANVEFAAAAGSPADLVYSRLTLLRMMRPVRVEKMEAQPDRLPSIEYAFTEQGVAGLPKLVGAAMARRRYFSRQVQDEAPS